MNIFQSEYKKLAEIHTNAMYEHLGQVVNDVWEVIRICSRVIDHCLDMKNVSNDANLMSLLLILRNMVSDVCCCMDAVERGHERTVFNNIRMILEDFSSVAHAKNDPMVLKKLLSGNYQASKSVSFLKKNYPSHGLNKIYGILSKISHHGTKELVVRQWINRNGLLSHLKPFDPNQKTGKLNALLLLTHMVRLAGEVAENLCFDGLDKSYFWITPTTQKNDIPIDEIIARIATKINFMENNNTVATDG